MRKGIIPAALFIVLFLALSYAVSPSEAAPRDYYLQFDKSAAQNNTAGGEESPDHSKPSVKKWLILFGTLAGFALTLLLLLELGGGGLLPDAVEDAIAKICIGIIAIALWLFLYYISSKIIFLVLIPITLCLIVYIYLHRIFKRMYTKKFGKPSSPDSWICRECGTENNNLLTECHSCGKRNPSEPELPT